MSENKEHIGYTRSIKEKLRFDTFDELEEYFEMNFDYFRSHKLKTKVIGKVIYVFK